MEENNNIDDLFRSALENNEMEPSEKSWNSLSSDLAKKRTARLFLRRLYYFIIPAVVLLVSFSAYKYFSHVNTNDEKAQNVTSANITQEKSTQNTNSLPTEIKQGTTAKDNLPAENKVNSSESTLEASNNKSTLTIPASKNESHTVSAADNNSSNHISQSVKNENQVSEKSKNKSQPVLAAAASTAVVKKAPVKSAPISNTPVSNTPVNTTDVNTSPVNNSDQPTTNNEALRQTENNSSPENQNIDNKIAPSSTVQDGAANNTSSTIPAESKAVIAGAVIVENNSAAPHLESQSNGASAAPDAQSSPSAQVNQTAQTNQTTQPEEKISDYQAAQKPDSSPSLIKKIYKNISVGAYYSPEIIKQHLTANDSYTGSASKNVDDYDNASSQYSYATGFNLNYDIGKKWNIGSGVAFSSYSISSVYNSISVVSDSAYQQEKDEHENNGHGHGHHGHGHNGHGNQPPTNHHNNHHYVVHTPCGDIDLTHEPPQGNTSEEGDTLSVKTEIFETVHFISVPLVVQYKFGQKKLSYFIEAGGSINFVNKDRVKVVVNDAYTEENNLNSLSSYNYSLQLGLGAQYNIYKGLSMYLKPSMRYSITPVNLDSPVNSYPYFFGLGAGFTVHF